MFQLLRLLHDKDMGGEFMEGLVLPSQTIEAPSRDAVFIGPDLFRDIWVKAERSNTKRRMTVKFSRPC